MARSILIIGAGRFGQSLAIKLSELRNEVMLVDIKPDAVGKMEDLVTCVKIGDCMDIDVLKELGVRNFDVCFVCISANFQSSMEITSLLKELGAKYVVAKSDRQIHTELLYKIGADDVIYPEQDMAQRTAIRYSAKGAFDCIELSKDYAIMEIKAPKHFVGKNIKELDVRLHYGINILAFRQDQEILPLLSAEHVFCEGEHLIVAGKQGDILNLLNKAN